MGEFTWVMRRVRRRPVFATMFVTIFGGSLGISLVVLTLARATIGTALPYDEPAGLVSLSENRPEEGIERMVSSYRSLEDWRDRSTSLENIGGVRTQLGTTLQLENRSLRLSGAVVSASMFEVLRVAPLLGRAFSAEEDGRGAGITSVVVSHTFWTESLGADPNVLGTPLTLNAVPWTVVGVLPAGTTLAPHYRETVDVWFPTGAAALIDGPPVYDNRGYRIFQLIGRLRDEATTVGLQDDVARLSAELEAENPEAHSGWRWEATPLRSHVLRGVDGPVLSVFGGGVLLFMVAVVNLLALFVQSLRRDLDELATRRVLGAGMGGLVRLGLLELAVLGLAGGVLALTIGGLGVRVLPGWFAISLPVYARVDFDPLLILSAFLAAELLVLLGGAVLMALTMRSVASSPMVGGRVVGAGRSTRRATTASLTGQIVLTTILAIGATVAARSFDALSRVDPGIDPEGLTAVRIDVAAESRAPSDVPVLAEEVRQALAAVPGVAAVHLWSPHVPTAAQWYTRVRLLDRPDLSEAELPAVRINSVSPGAVQGIGLRILAGRDIAEGDRTAGRRVVLVSESAAEAWWGGADLALGRSIRRWNHDEWSDVIGVVADAPLSGRRGEGSDFLTDVYFLFEVDVQRQLVFLARSESGAPIDPALLRESARIAAPDLPAYDIRTMADRLAEQDGLARSAALLGAIFAITAIVLAALGLYGAATAVAARRRREMGLRQALGASPVRVVSELTASTTRIVGMGLVAGVVAARYALDPLDPTLFVVGPRDAPSYMIGVAVIILAAMAALALPALRALRTSPAVTLREG